jgi:hypothetical protein
VVPEMTKEQVVDKIKELLNTRDDLSFMLQLRLEDLETQDCEDDGDLIKEENSLFIKD